jgi:hypothetical protein
VTTDPGLALPPIKPSQRKFLAALAEHGFKVAPSAKAIGIHERTGWRWLADPKVRPHFDKLVADSVPLIEAAHVAAGLERDTLARIHILKNRHPLYRETQRIEVEHKTIPIESISVAALPALAASAAALIAPALAQVLAGKDKADLAKPVIEAEATTSSGFVRQDGQ